jgi:hypothetical protein
MSKPLKPAAELVALLDAELRKQDACTGVSVEGVTPVADEKVAYTWTATALRRASSSRRCACFNSGMIYCPRRIYRHKIGAQRPLGASAAP